jgi:hypothetical protein
MAVLEAKPRIEGPRRAAHFMHEELDQAAVPPARLADRPFEQLVTDLAAAMRPRSRSLQTESV